MKTSSPQSIGIDIAKSKFDAAFFYGGDIYKVKTFDNDRVGIADFIGSLKRQRTAETVPCVVESTGQYHLSVALMLEQAGLLVNCINPIITKQYQKSSIRNAKTDTVDAMRLAKIGALEPNLPIFKGDLRSIEANKLVSFLGKLEQTKRRLESSLKQVRNLEEITGLKIDTVSAGKAIRDIENQIKTLKERLVEICPREALELAEKTKGLSKEQAAVIFSVLGGKKFKTRDQLVAYVGYDISARKSGKWTGKEKLSKRGNAQARKTLFHIAWGLKQHNPFYKAYYEKLRKDKRSYRECLIIVGRKFLRSIFAQYWKDGGYPQFAS